MTLANKNRQRGIQHTNTQHKIGYLNTNTLHIIFGRTE